MCGRFSITQVDKLAERFRLVTVAYELMQRFNLCPSQDAPVILNVEPRALQPVQWGLIPAWAKDPKIGYKMINARAETIDQKPAYKRPFQKQRCLVVADGFYEWQKTGGAKQPFRITLKSGEPFAFAGVWDQWTHPETGEPLKTFSIITTAANDMMRSIHDRMPAMLLRENEDAWLDLKTPPEKAKSFLQPYPSEELKAVPISRLINSPANDSAAVIERV